MISKKWILMVSACLFASCLVHATGSIGFATDPTDGAVFAFNADDTSTPATLIISSINNPACITTSPDGNTVYFTSNATVGNGGDVYSFPLEGPYVATRLNTGIANPVGIAISSDGLTGFVTDGTNIWTFPTGGSSPHTATELTSVGATIAGPTFIVISGNTAYVGGFGNWAVDSVYSFPISNPASSQTTYNAALAVTGNTYAVNGLAVSNDGNLYFSSNVNSILNASIFQVPLSSIPTSSPNFIIEQIFNGWYGLAVSTDGTMLYAASTGNGIYAMPTNEGVVAMPTLLSGLDLSNAFQLAIAAGTFDPAPSSPSNLTGVQKTNDFGLVYELYNVLYWQASPQGSVVGYNIYRDGKKIASVDASTLTYQDHNRKRGSAYNYSVTSFDASGNESSPINFSIN